MPTPPGYLSSDAREVWDRLAPSLHAEGVLTIWDAEMFARFCDLTVKVREAGRLLEIGLLVRGRREGFVTNPAWRVYRDGLSLLRSYAQEFGLTPSARSLLRREDPGIAGLESLQEEPTAGDEPEGEK